MKHLRSKLVKIRKPKRCFGCCTGFSSGAILKSSTSVGDWGISTIHLCKTCEDYINEKTPFFDDGFQEDGVNEGRDYFGDQEVIGESFNGDNS